MSRFVVQEETTKVLDEHTGRYKFIRQYYVFDLVSEKRVPGLMSKEDALKMRDRCERKWQELQQRKNEQNPVMKTKQRDRSPSM